MNHCRLIPELSGGIGTEDGAVIIENGRILHVWSVPADMSGSPADASEVRLEDLPIRVLPPTSDAEQQRTDLSEHSPARPSPRSAYRLTAAASGERVIDCAGRTLLPGLIDLHTHVTGLSDYDWKDESQLSLQAGRYLAHGFTTIRDCGSMERAANRLRDMVRDGVCEGPRIISCGRILIPTEVPSTDPLMPMYDVSDGPYEMLKSARTELAEGGEFIKIMASGSAFHPTGVPDQPILLDEELQMCVTVARFKGSYVAAHAHSDAAIAQCARLGVRTIEHATYIRPETIELVRETKNCWLVPTLAAMYVSVPDESGFWTRRLGDMLQECADNIRSASQAGLSLGFGTDSAPDMEQYEKGIEFRFRKELCGMENLDILLQATRNSARILGLEDVVGEIREGLAADLILVDGKPDQDLSVMYRRPERVWKAGKEVTP